MQSAGVAVHVCFAHSDALESARWSLSAAWHAHSGVLPETRYAQKGDAPIAYQVVGEPVDLAARIDRLASESTRGVPLGVDVTN